MGSIQPKFHHGPLTYDVSGTVTAGQLVTPTGTTGQVATAGDGDTTVLGVALIDADDAYADGISLDGDDIVVKNVTATTTVAVRDVVPVTAAASTSPGARVKAAASGQVTPFVSGTDTDPSLIVGICVSKTTVAADETALILLNA